MHWLRRTTLYFLSLVLFASITGVALSTATRLSLTNPKQTEAWLDQSGLYEGLVDTIINQASANSSSTVPFKDPAVQAAAKTALAKPVVTQATNTIIESNYAWLNGTASTPSFSVDLTKIQQDFASNIAQLAKAKLASLPQCSPAQLATLQNTQDTNPFTLVCRPANMDITAVTAQLQQAVAQSGALLPNTSITPTSLNPTAATQPQAPYYKTLDWLPKAYRAALQLPWVAGVFAVLSSASIIIVATTRRRGIARLSSLLLLGGAGLIALEFVTNKLLSKLQSGLASGTGANIQLQNVLVSFLGKAQSHAMAIVFWFGVGFITAGLVGILFYFATRKQTPKAPRPPAPLETTPIEPTPITPIKQPSPRPPRRPRLIQ